MAEPQFKMNQRQIAEAYAEAGIAVFPCNPKNKSPLVKGGFKAATSDSKTVSEWWKKHPHALIGSPDPSFVVMDIDDYNLDPGSKFIVKSVKKELYECGLVQKDFPHVTTMSGGTHVYFRGDSELTRHIKSLPQIDLLGNGGYVILPDNTNYHSNYENPWEMMNNLPTLDVELFESLCEKHKDVTKSVSAAVKRYRNAHKGEAASVKVSTKGKAKAPSAKHEHRREVNAAKRRISDMVEQVNVEVGDDANVSHVDYDTDTITFKIKDGIYAISENEYERANPTEKLLDENGKLTIPEDGMDSDFINRTFHNQQIQMKLVELLGVTPPTPGDTKSIHSLFPNHIDENKSMGIRWSRDKSHVIFRDFSNFYADQYNQVDYNVVRMYATTAYKTNIPRLSSVEFVVWFTRMLCDAGMIDITPYMKEYACDVNDLSKQNKKVAEGFLYLDAIRSLYNGYLGITAFSDKFAARWCGVSLSTCNRAKTKMQERHFLKYEGEYNCVEKRDDGFFNTRLFSVITEDNFYDEDETETKEVEQEVTTNQTNEEANEMDQFDEATTAAATGVSNVGAGSANLGPKGMYRRGNNGVSIVDKEEVEGGDYLDMKTIVGITIDEADHEKIKNFCEDFDLNEAPDKQNMFVPILIGDKYDEVPIPSPKNMLTYTVGDVTLDVQPSAADGFDYMVVGYFNSNPLSKLLDQVNEKHENLIQEDNFWFVIANQLSPEEANALDLSYLTLKFNEYVKGGPSFTNMFIRHMQEPQAVMFIDGQEPIDE